MLVLFSRLVNLADHDFVVVGGSRSLGAAHSSLVFETAPIAVAIMPPGCCVGRLLPPVVFENQLVLDGCLQPVLLLVIAEFSIFTRATRA